MKKIKIILSLLLVLCSGIVFAQDTIRVRVMTYNLRFGELASMEEIAQHIKSFNPDFVALQEVDYKTYRKRTPHQHGVDFLGELAHHTGMFGIYGKTIDYASGYYGIGILSKYSYITTKKTMLPKTEERLEQRALLEGLFEVGNDTIVFASTHLDAMSDETRSIQFDKIKKCLEASQYPVLLGGDFNTRSTSSLIKKMDNWFLGTDSDFGIPSWKPIAKIDYIFGYPQKGWEIISTQTIQSLLSDHMPIITELIYIKPNSKK